MNIPEHLRPRVVFSTEAPTLHPNILQFVNVFISQYGKGAEGQLTTPIPGIVTRVLRGSSEEDFHQLSNRKERRIVFPSNASSAFGLIGHDINGMLRHIGYPQEMIDGERRKGTSFRLFVSHESYLQGALFPATWENLCVLAEQTIQEQGEMKHIDFARRNFPGKSSAQILTMGREYQEAWDYFARIAGINALYVGDGYTSRLSEKNRLSKPEVIMLDKEAALIPHIMVELPKLNNCIF